MRTTLGLILTVTATSEAGVTADYAVAEQWDNFKKKYHKTYATAQLESYRRSIFHQNAMRIRKLNAVDPHGVYGLDRMSDLTEAEFAAEMGIASALLQEDDPTEQVANSSLEVEVEKGQGPAKRSMQTAAAAVINVDHRTNGLVGRVKSQAKCAWCGFYGAVGALEGAWAKTGAPFVSLSEEYTAACRSKDVRNVSKHCSSGTNGKWVFEWIININKGEMVSEEDYPNVVPFTGGNAVCNRTGKPVAARFNSLKSLGTSKNETEWAQIVVQHGPMYVTAGTWAFYGLTGGIGTACAWRANHGLHAMTIVGVNLVHNPPYWIMKNSWGARWGDQGYIKLIHGKNCGGLRGTYGDMMVMTGGALTAAPTPEPTPVPTPEPTPEPTPDMCPAECTPKGRGTATLRYLPKRRSLKSVRYSSATKLTGCYLQVQAATGQVKVSMYTSTKSGGRLRTMLPSLSGAKQPFKCTTRCEKEISHEGEGGVQQFTYGARIKIQCHGKVDCRNIKWKVKCWAF